MKFLKNAWYGAIWGDELGNRLITRRFLNEPVVLYRKADGMPVALADRCPHRFAPLSMGTLLNDQIECLYHGLRFDCSGTCTDNPNGAGLIPKAAKVRSYPLHERWGMVWIWMGDPEFADPDLIPDLPWLTDTTHYASMHGYLKLNANYLLVNDNLTDLSHASFVHVKTLEPREMAREIFKLTEEDGTIWTRLFYSGMSTPVFFKAIPGIPEKVDHWLEMRCDPPGTMVTFYGVTPVGRPREEGYDTCNPNITTPETEWTTHYFWGSARTFALDDHELTSHLKELVELAFNTEDKPIIEGQQQIIGQNELMQLQPVLLPNDGGSGRARRFIELRIVAEEQSAAKPLEAVAAR
ncbi:Dicamba O-demethylase, oxygenase component [Paraburkholderia gardini]|uniref:Dicamba O-demethylase, oxygenase component n=2 Tax=Paraburkholderia gardini TaxID=2823469 RepID=A0ABN7QRS1_9BURK|nr:Dicamba O-demethylase, oxygenase component [Paraburkholderia gardini]